jgi:hypothetical protein
MIGRNREIIWWRIDYESTVSYGSLAIRLIWLALRLMSVLMSLFDEKVHIIHDLL